MTSTPPLSGHTSEPDRGTPFNFGRTHRNNQRYTNFQQPDSGLQPRSTDDVSGPIFTKLTNSLNSIVIRTNLPPLEIVRFEGDPCAYFQFKSRFNEMVDSQDLTDSQKMSRILQFLNGKAKSTVSGFEGIPGDLNKAMPESASEPFWTTSSRRNQSLKTGF